MHRFCVPLKSLFNRRENVRQTWKNREKSGNLVQLCTLLLIRSSCVYHSFEIANVPSHVYKETLY